MSGKQNEFLHTLRSKAEELTKLHMDYWRMYSDFESWEFWVLVGMLIIPLIVLFLFIDKRRAFLLGFFGLNYHVWFAYTNAIGIRMGLWEYPYNLVPMLPSFALDASLVPVLFILLYQWTLNHNKNKYLYPILLSAVLAFIFKPILVSLDLFRMFEWVNYIHLFIFYVAFFVVSKWIADIFIWLEKRTDENIGH